MKKLFIFGTAHSLQIGSSSKNSIHDRLLRDEIERNCIDNGVQLIAEEMSEEALRLAGIPETIGQIVAIENELDHVYCDPPGKLRKELGIRDTQLLRMDALLDNWSANKLNNELNVSWDLREKYILNCISENNHDCVFLICGSDHVERFVEKSCAYDFESFVVQADWHPA